MYDFIIIIVFILLCLISLFFKCTAVWISVRNKNIAWFLVMCIIGTAGILPIIYLYKTGYFFEDRKHNKLIKGSAILLFVILFLVLVYNIKLLLL